MIEPARIEDVPLLLSLIRELAEYEKLSHEVVATEEGLRETLFGDRPYAEAVIARVDGEPAGFALFFPNYSTFLGKPGLYLEDLFVRPAFRGRGIGRKLLSHITRIARDRGYGRVEWAVLDWNEPAIAFYRKLGAVPKDAWTIFRLALSLVVLLPLFGCGTPQAPPAVPPLVESHRSAEAELPFLALAPRPVTLADGAELPASVPLLLRFRPDAATGTDLTIAIEGDGGEAWTGRAKVADDGVAVVVAAGRAVAGKTYTLVAKAGERETFRASFRFAE